MNSIKDFFKKIDLSDILIVLGLAVLGYGLWQYKPWVSWATIGGILLIMGIYGSIPKKG